MRTYTWLLVLVAVFTPAIVGAGGGAESGPIKIGVSGPHSGDLASYGIPTMRAAELIAARINADGGLLERQIELVIEDDQCDPAIATNAAARLVGEEVVAVIGHVCSGATRAALNIYADENIPTISATATSPGLTKDGEFSNFFRTIAPDDAQGALQAGFVGDTLGVQSVAILHDGGDYGRGLADLARAAVEADFPGVEVLLYEGITVGGVDYSAIINRVADSGADTVIFGGYHPEAARLVSQMRTQGLETSFLSGDSVHDNAFIAVAGADAEGVYATGPRDNSGNPIASDAIAAHQEAYGEEPGAFYQEGWAAMLALTNAIEAAGSTEADAIMQALRGLTVETSVGRIGFDEAGDATGVGFAVYQVQGGQYVQVQ